MKIRRRCGGSLLAVHLEAPAPPDLAAMAMSKANLKRTIGHRFLFGTGLEVTVRGHMENTSIPGTWYEREMVVFAPLGRGTLACMPLSRFERYLRPWGERRITGTGPNCWIYGPAPITASDAGPIETKEILP